MNGGKTIGAGVLSVVFILIVAFVLIKTSHVEPSLVPEITYPGDVLWNTRNFETILQGFILLSGVFAILMLLRASRREPQV